MTMELHKIAAGGLQFILPVTAQQIIFLDFDGAFTDYNGDVLSIENVEVFSSNLPQERIDSIVAELNIRYSPNNVKFVTEIPSDKEYSTIFIGNTRAFQNYGNFTGLAETLDRDNRNKQDKAFVLLDNAADDETIISAILHETGHITGQLRHPGNGLQAYAANIIIPSETVSSGIELTDNNMTVARGGIADSTTINSSGFMYVDDGGIAYNTQVNNWGDLFVSSGGFVSNTTLNYGGWMHICDGGTASRTEINSGMLEISSGGTANDVILNTGGYLFIANGGSALNVTWTPCAGMIDVEEGAYVSYSSQFSGVYLGSDNHLLSHTSSLTGQLVTRDGCMYIMQDGTADGTILNGRSKLYISQGGLADNTTISNANLYVYTQGTATHTEINTEGNLLISGGFTDNTVINELGTMNVYSAGSANSTTVNTGGLLAIYSNGESNNTTVNTQAVIHIFSGGIAKNTMLNSGNMYINSQGTASNTVISANGGDAYLYLSGGAVHQGQLNIGSGAKVSAASGAVIDYTLSDRTESSDYLVNNLSLITGSPSYRITVTANQASGKYKLAQGAENFTGTISIGNVSKQYGSLTVNGANLKIENHIFALKKESGNLTLSVTAVMPDIAISNLVMPTTASYMDNVKITFDVVNSGSSKAASSYVYLYDGDTRINSVLIPELAAGGTYSTGLTIKGKTLQQGSHNIRLVADATNTIKETNESNNTVERTLQLNTPANLAITGWQMSSAASEKDNIVMTFNVVNGGGSPAGRSYVYLYDGNTRINMLNIPRLAAGGSYQASLTIKAGTLSKGVHNIQLKADATAVVPESNESNTVSKSLQINAAANLAITGFNMVAAASPQDNVKLYFNVVNGGETVAGASYVYLYDGDTKINGVAIKALNPGEVYATGMTIKAGVLSAGTHTIKLVADATNQVSESNENNTVSKSISIQNMPDLAITDLDIADENSVKSNIKVYFNVVNNGTATAKSSYAFLYDGNTKLNGVLIPELAVGASYSTGMTIKAGTLSLGSHKLRVVADGSGVVAESNESNEAAKTVAVKNAPNLAITGFTMASSATAGENIKLYFNVVNGGETLAGSSYVYLYDGDTKINGVAVKQLAAGEVYATGMTIKAGVLSAGSHTIKLVADATGKVAESNENNTVSRNITIAAASAGLPSGCLGGNDWGAVEIMDCNGDGYDDVLLSNGTDLDEYIQLTQSQQAEQFGLNAESGWSIGGVADFNLDGKNEMLLLGSVSTTAELWKEESLNDNKGLLA